jgi:hypothetical protein
MNQRITELLTHYTTFWGEASHITSHDVDNATLNSISVVDFTPRTAEENWVYATLGMSNTPMHFDLADQRLPPHLQTEVFIYS